MTNTNWFLLILLIIVLSLVAGWVGNNTNTSGIQFGGQYFNWWNPYTWYNWRTYPLDISYYPSYDYGYIDGNSRGWYNDYGWYGQTRPRYYGRRYRW